MPELFYIYEKKFADVVIFFLYFPGIIGWIKSKNIFLDYDRKPNA